MYATNSAFSMVENPQFRAMMDLVRPGIQLPGRRAISGRILEDVYAEEWEKFAKEKKGMHCTMSIDGWSNIKNDPILGIMVDAHLVETIDTGGDGHTDDYLAGVLSPVSHFHLRS